jgi:dolichol-phosphate mannosyltransferase
MVSGATAWPRLLPASPAVVQAVLGLRVLARLGRAPGGECVAAVRGPEGNGPAAPGDRVSVVLPVLSVATVQEVSGAGEALLHPALLTTLVYRLGAPGRATRRPREVLANGQCLLARRDLLLAGGGFRVARDSRCDDVTLARHLARAGHAVGFYESDAPVSVRMHASAGEAWRTWPRSLPLHDGAAGAAVLGLLEVSLVQALPLPLLAGLLAAGSGSAGGRAAGRGGAWLGLLAVNGLLAAVRLGVLAGTARAYRPRPWTYWLSPLCDIPATLALWRSLGRRDHVWRGRMMATPAARKGERRCGGGRATA